MRTLFKRMLKNKLVLGLFAAGALTIAANGNIQIVRAANNPGDVTSLPTEAFTNDVAMNGTFAYIADATGITTVSLVDPQRPSIVSRTNTAVQSVDVEAENNVLYTVNMGLGVMVYDLTQPNAPVASYTIDTPGSAAGIDVVNNLAYVADGSSGLTVIDLLQKKVISNMAISGYSKDVVVNNNYAYVANSNGKIDIINLSTKKVVRFIRTAGLPESLVVKDNVLYVAELDYGMQVFNVAIPTNPIMVSDVKTAESPRDIAVDGNDVFLMTYGNVSYSRYYRFDITRPSKPISFGYDNVQPYGLGIAVQNHNIVIANGENGVTIQANKY